MPLSTIFQLYRGGQLFLIDFLLFFLFASVQSEIGKKKIPCA
jgi:hypothetical protein